MEIFRHFNALPPAFRGSAVAVGNFDGVHLGHQAVIGEAGRIARAGTTAGDMLPWTVLTFEPHPRHLFQPDTAPFRLTPFPTKARAIAALGVDALVVLHFDRAFSERSAESFIGDILCGGLGARHVVCGYDFVFGHKRGGDVRLLLSEGQRLGFDFTSVAAVGDSDGTVYSATRVRQCLAAGDALGAAAVLGRPFEIAGAVERGEARGRTIGFPTANVALDGYVRPQNGVYAVRARIDNDEKPLDGVANIGVRPTFSGNDVTLEVYLFDFDGDFYDRTLSVGFIDRIRDEMRFDGIDHLKAQIAADCTAARKRLAGV